MAGIEYVKNSIKYMLPPLLWDILIMIKRKSALELDPYIQRMESDALESFAFMPSSFLKKYLYYWNELTELDSIPGDIVEFGVHQGTTLSYLCHLTEILDHPNSSRKIIGFDTFNGFPNAKQMRESSYATDKKYSNSFTNTSKNYVLKKFKNRDKNRVHLIEGDIFQTLPKHLASWPNKICMAICDVDTDKTTQFILENVWDRMSPGGRIYFDEYSLDGWSETVGVAQFLKSRGISLECVKRGSHQPSAYIQR